MKQEHDATSPENDSPTESLRKMGHAMIAVANALEDLPRDAQLRVIKAVAILKGVELPGNL